MSVVQVRRPRVLQVCVAVDGGASEHVLRLSEVLSDRGWDITVATPPGWLAEASAGAGLRVMSLPLRRAPHLPTDFLGLMELIREMRPGGYDVVHLHSAKAGFVGRLAARLAGGVPTVYTPHAWPFLMDDQPRMRTAWTLMERLGARLGSAVICVSRDEREAGERAKTLGRGRVKHIANGVAIPDRAAVFRDGPGVVIGTIARLSPQKGLDVLIDAAARTIAAAPSTRFQIIGRGPLGDAIRAQAEALRIRHAVTIREDLVGQARDVLADFDVFVLPSRWEGMPIALLEACAAGLPCVATRVGGVSEVIDDGVSGIIVPVGDAGGLTDAFLRLVGDPGLRQSMGRAARARVAGGFSLEAMASAIELLYLEVALGDALTG